MGLKSIWNNHGVHKQICFKVYEWFQNLTETYSYVDTINIGKSYEGRDVKVVRMSKDLNAKRPAIFIDSSKIA
jgi:hypothetical protein